MSVFANFELFLACFFAFAALAPRFFFTAIVRTPYSLSSSLKHNNEPELQMVPHRSGMLKRCNEVTLRPLQCCQAIRQLRANCDPRTKGR